MCNLYYSCSSSSTAGGCSSSTVGGCSSRYVGGCSSINTGSGNGGGRSNVGSSTAGGSSSMSISGCSNTGSSFHDGSSISDGSSSGVGGRGVNGGLKEGGGIRGWFDHMWWEERSRVERLEMFDELEEWKMMQVGKIGGGERERQVEGGEWGKGGIMVKEGKKGCKKGIHSPMCEPSGRVEDDVGRVWAMGGRGRESDVGLRGGGYNWEGGPEGKGAKVKRVDKSKEWKMIQIGLGKCRREGERGGAGKRGVCVCVCENDIMGKEGGKEWKN